jgi:hypothetical protein
MTTFLQPLNPAYPAGVAGIYDYASLKQAVQDWNARSDVANFVDYFIQRAEQTIYNDIFSMNKGAGVKPMEAALSTVIANGVVPLPTGYRALKYMTLTVGSSTYQLERRNAEFIYTQYPFRAASSPPQYVARDGSNFVFGPFPDSGYAVSGVYWKQSPQLTVTNTVTWMTTFIPLILLAACNKGIAAFNKDQDAMAWWDADYKDQMASFLLSDRAEEQSGSALAMVAA